ncbi:Alpha/Beta hydrolase protein [Aspergillus carlsbadensis]|nr:Alpha/Beta hydrolase protein [Aspergillus carlsbadensis]
MERLEQKTLKTRRSLNYTYYASTAGESKLQQEPALLFLHGFPDSAHLWTRVLGALEDLPHQVIVPDCLGYAGTDKPSDTSLYAYHQQAQDLEDLLRHERVDKAILIGHDWGSALAQRLYLHKRHLVSGVILLNTAYMVPSGERFDLAAVNSMTEKAFGYPQFAYWEFLLTPDAAQIVDQHLERMWQVLHGDVEHWMKRIFCVPGAMCNFLLGDDEVPLKDYARQPEWKQRYLQQFRSDGFAAALQMYKATAWNIQAESDSALLSGDLAIRVPLLFVICSKDAVCMREMMAPAKERGLVPNLTEVVVDAGHWSPMERPEEIAQQIRDFVSQATFKN